jgi:hypothetical protein
MQLEYACCTSGSQFSRLRLYAAEDTVMRSKVTVMLPRVLPVCL